MDTPSRTTELEAVNIMLSLLGETAVNNLVAPFTEDVANARRLLSESSKEIQAEGWKFNTEDDYTLSENAAGEVLIPTNALSVDADTSGLDLVVRGERLYDVKNHTFLINKDIKVEIVWMFPFDELPEAARQYILIHAARRLQYRFLGSGEQNNYSAMNESRARVNLMVEQAKTADANIFNGEQMAYITRGQHSTSAQRLIY